MQETQLTWAPPWIWGHPRYSRGSHPPTARGAPRAAAMKCGRWPTKLGCGYIPGAPAEDRPPTAWRLLKRRRVEMGVKTGPKPKEGRSGTISSGGRLPTAQVAVPLHACRWGVCTWQSETTQVCVWCAVAYLGFDGTRRLDLEAPSCGGPYEPPRNEHGTRGEEKGRLVDKPQMGVQNRQPPSEAREMVVPGIAPCEQWYQNCLVGNSSCEG